MNLIVKMNKLLILVLKIKNTTKFILKNYKKKINLN